MKFLLWALVIYVAWRWYETKQRKASNAEPSVTATDDAAERMVACTQCGMHLPLSEAVHGMGAQYFCCDAHRANHSDA